MAEFEAFPKIARLRREVTISEKLDGTNGCIVIEKHPFGAGVDLVQDYPFALTSVCGTERGEDGLPVDEFFVYAQSRSRLLSLKTDNFGFAKWVQWHAVQLVAELGEGSHFGEWWGQGIQRGYGQARRRFSLFNTHRWADLKSADPYATNRSLGPFTTPQPLLDVVPVISQGVISDHLIDDALASLRYHGSWAAPGFTKPEGVVVYHRAANKLFKVLLENDSIPKSLAA